MTRIRHIRTLLLVFVSIFFSATPVHAEDIEIYLTSNEGSGANILLLIDTSAATHRNFPGTTYSDGGKTVDEIVYALQQVIDGLAGPTRIGVASQLQGGDNGGAINYPVLQIDETVSPVAVSRVTHNAADAIQHLTVTSVPTATNDPVNVSWGAFEAGDLLPMPSILSTTDPENVLALMLSDVAVPRYAKVTRARLTMKSPSSNSGTTNSFNLRIAHEQSAAPAPYTSTADLSNRVWSLPFDNGNSSYNASGSLSANVITLDVTNVIQSAVAETFWCGGEDLSLLIQGTSLNASSVPQIYSYRAEDSTGTRLGSIVLEVEWSATEQVAPPATAVDDEVKSCMGDVIYSLAAAEDDGVETTAGGNLQTDQNTLDIQNVTTGPASRRGDHVGGARFAGVQLPAGTSVNAATLSGNITAASGTSPKLVIKPMLGNVAPFTTAGSISNVATGATSAEVAAVVGPFSVDVSALINEIFSSGWVTGGALGLRLERSGTSVSVHALDGGAASGLTLNMEVLAVSPMVFVTTFNRRSEMKIAVQEFSDSQGGGNNKPVSSYTEGGRYMLGVAPKYGISISHADAFSSSDRTDYLPPAERYDQCGGNHIVMVTHADSNGESFKSDIDALTATNECPSDTNADAWNCAGVLASYLADGTRNPTGLPVQTHTISFAADADVVAALADVAVKGKGQSYTSTNAAELAEKLSELINQLTTTDASMAAPGVAVNQLNRFRHLDQLYYALFRPAEYDYWEGNLKRYRIDFSADPPAIVDENGSNAVDPDTGFFKDTSNSWWGTRADGSDPDDGQNVDQGGAREELYYRTDARVVWTVDASPAVTGSATATSASGGVVATELPATVDASTASAMGARLGMASPEADDPVEVQQRLDLAHGGWADPLHSEPRLVNFGFTGTFEEAVLDDSKQTNVAFITTNGGALHAVEPKTGTELFSFIPPEELLKTEKRFQKDKLNGADPQRSTYGLDGGITVWRKAKNDGSGQPEHVFLYMGQRRGGRSYYALDVSDIDTSVDTTTTPAAPNVMWEIEGGVAPFSKLGQTWSQPTLAQIKLNGQKVPVLIFGGGYSATDHDTKGSVSGADGTGNAIYIVNAYTGALIWSASNTGGTLNNGDMKWSIPASVSVVDINFDGVIDYLYAADLGGQIFRVDLNAENTGASSLAFRVVTLAKLGTSASGGIANHRRFHAPPVVALSRRNDETILQVALGSGYRSHPLDTQTDDRIYVVDDYDALSALATDFTPSAVIYEGDLLDVTNNTSPSSSEFSGKSGWFIDLQEVGEKVLSAGAIADGVLYITTFLPETSYVNECQRVIGAAQLYGVNILDGSPALDPNNSGTLTRTTLIRLPGLPPSPQLLLGEGGERVILIGTATVDQEDSENLGLRKTRWYEASDEAEAQAVLDNAAQGQ